MRLLDAWELENTKMKKILRAHLPSNDLCFCGRLADQPGSVLVQ